MARRPTCGLPLFDWEPPPAPAVRFSAGQVRAATRRAEYSRAMKLAAEESGKSRDQIAQDMTEYMGEAVAKSAVDAAISEAREDRTMSIERYEAFVFATGDMRLIGVLADKFDMIVVPKHYEHWILAAQLEEKRKELEKLEAAHRRLARNGGAP